MRNVASNKPHKRLSKPHVRINLRSKTKRRCTDRELLDGNSRSVSVMSDDVLYGESLVDGDVEYVKKNRAK